MKTEYTFELTIEDILEIAVRKKAMGGIPIDVNVELTIYRAGCDNVTVKVDEMRPSVTGESLAPKIVNFNPVVSIQFGDLVTPIRGPGNI